MLDQYPNSTDQISKYLNENISSDTKIQIANFAILWNCFEKLCDDRKLYVNNSDTIIDFDLVINLMRLTNDDHKFIDEVSHDFKIYLESKMVLYDIINIKEYFYMSYPQYYEIKNCILLNEDSESRKDDLKVLMYVIKRVRNNMYHGNKEVRTLDSQLRLFELCNKLLIFILYKLGCKDIINI